mmetsp:Transcript_17520/g.37505  ORF Transcript_17520/g.37505 Transcript_17520/m.37505 type:complete len:237 (-) Transcript_17520:323-1033(-)
MLTRPTCVTAAIAVFARISTMATAIAPCALPHIRGLSMLYAPAQRCLQILKKVLYSAVQDCKHHDPCALRPSGQDARMAFEVPEVGMHHCSLTNVYPLGQTVGLTLGRASDRFQQTSESMKARTKVKTSSMKVPRTSCVPATTSVYVSLESWSEGMRPSIAAFTPFHTLPRPPFWSPSFTKARLSLVPSNISFKLLMYLATLKPVFCPNSSVAIAIILSRLVESTCIKLSVLPSEV